MSCEGVIKCKAKVNWKLDFHPCFYIIIVIYHHNDVISFNFFHDHQYSQACLILLVLEKINSKEYFMVIVFNKKWEKLFVSWGERVLFRSGIFPLKAYSQKLSRGQLFALHLYFSKVNTAIKPGESYLCWHNCIVIQHPHLKHFTTGP